MGIIDSYFSGSSDDSPPPASKASGNVINQYMTITDSEPKRKTSAPTGYNAATGTIEYQTPEEVNKATVTGSHTRSLSEIPVKAAAAGLNAVKSGVLEAGSGLSDTLSGKPATGLGKIGMGALSILGSPTEPISSAVSDITGSESAGSKAALIAGAGLPVAKVAKSVIAARPTNRALKDLTEMVGPENAGKVAAEMRADPRLTPADLSPAVQSATQKLFTVEGDKTKNYVAGFVDKRASEAKQAVDDAMNASLGSTVDPYAKVNQLKQNIKEIGAKDINPAVVGAKPVDITPAIEHIDKTLKPGVNAIFENPENLLPYDKIQKTFAKFRENLTNDAANATDANQLHKLQSGLRRTADTLVRSTDPEGKALGHALYGLRAKIVDAIDVASPQVNGTGTYKPALAKYRDENHIQDAFEHGHDAILKNGHGLEDRPEFFKAWLNSATDAEKQAAKEGARIAIDTAIHGFRTPATNPASRSIQMGQVDFNRQRVEALFGKEEAAKLFKKLDNERIISDTNNKLINNSQTAMRSAADSRVALPERGQSKGLSQYVVPALGTAAEIGGSMAGLPTGIGGALGTGAALLGMGAKKAGSEATFAIKTALAKEKNAQLAKYALPTEGTSRDELIKHLEAVAAEHSRPRLSLGSRARLAIAP